jgi:selenocysteine-specific elongation factor
MDADKKKSVILPGSEAPVQILTESKITVAAGQRFVIRFYSPLVTIGGGRILLPNAGAVKGRAEREAKSKIIAELSNDFGPVPLLAAIVRDKGILSVSSLFALSQMEKKIFDGGLNQLSATDKYGLLEFGSAKNFISADAFETVVHAVLRLLKEFHAKYPELAGIDAEKLLVALDDVHEADKFKGGDFKELIGIMVARNIISSVAVQNKTCYRVAEHSASVDKKFTELLERIREESVAAVFNMIKVSELEEKLKSPAAYMKRAVKYLRDNENLRVLEGGLVFPRQTQEQLLKVLSSMNGDITVASLRDAIGVNRKQSLLMLDFLDTQGLTQRVGDKRVLRG